MDHRFNQIETTVRDDTPWYRQFWPWFLIALPATAVIAGVLTLLLAIENPDPVIIDNTQYRDLDHALKAQQPLQKSTQKAVPSEQAKRSH